MEMTHFQFSLHGTNQTRGEIIAEKLYLLTNTYDYFTFIATSLFLAFFVARSLVTFPFYSLAKFCCGHRTSSRLDITTTTTTTSFQDKSFHKITLRELKSRIAKDCYLFARPIARLIMVLIFTEWMSTAPSMLNKIFKKRGVNPAGWCYYQGFSTQFWGFSSHMWSLMVAVWMFWILVLQRRKHILLLELGSHAVASGVTIVLTIIPMAMGAFGDGGGYCWITNETRRGKVLRFTVFYGPLWVCILITVVLYFATIVSMIVKQYKSFRGASSDKRRRHVATSMALYIKLLGFPFFYVILWIFPTVRRITDAAQGASPTWLRFLHGFNSLQGFFHVSVYFLSEIAGTLIDKMRKSEKMITEANLANDTASDLSTSSYEVFSLDMNQRWIYPPNYTSEMMDTPDFIDDDESTESTLRN